jgi:hypothetical protein
MRVVLEFAGELARQFLVGFPSGKGVHYVEIVINHCGVGFADRVSNHTVKPTRGAGTTKVSAGSARFTRFTRDPQDYQNL